MKSVFASKVKTAACRDLTVDFIRGADSPMSLDRSPLPGIRVISGLDLATQVRLLLVCPGLIAQDSMPRTPVTSDFAPRRKPEKPGSPELREVARRLRQPEFRVA